MGYLAKQNCGFICVLIINIFFFNQCLDYENSLMLANLSEYVYMAHISSGDRKECFGCL